MRVWPLGRGTIIALCPHSTYIYLKTKIFKWRSPVIEEKAENISVSAVHHNYHFIALKDQREKKWNFTFFGREGGSEHILKRITCYGKKWLERKTRHLGNTK